MFKYFLFLTFLSRWNRHLDYGIIYLAKLLQCSREKKSTNNHYHRQVARLLQIQSVEKICKKFVTHKINLDNCLGKFIHNYQKTKSWLQAGFAWRTLSLDGQTLQRAFSHSSKSILPGAMTKTSLLIRRKTKILTKTEVRQNIPDLVGLTG